MSGEGRVAASRCGDSLELWRQVELIEVDAEVIDAADILYGRSIYYCER